MKFLNIEMYECVEFVWVTNHYDIHRSGLCRYDNKLCYFKTANPETVFILVCNIYELSWFEKINFKLQKGVFELCVGYHWTYENKKRSNKINEFSPKTKKFLYSVYYSMFWKKFNNLVDR